MAGSLIKHHSDIYKCLNGSPGNDLPLLCPAIILKFNNSVIC